MTGDNEQGRLVQPILPGVPGLRVGDCQSMGGFGAIAAALPAARDAPLEAFDLPLTLAIEPRRRLLLPVVEGHERFKAEIDPHGIVSRRFPLFALAMADKSDVPMPIGRLLDRRALDGPFHGAVETGLDRPDLRDAHMAVAGDHALRDAKRVRCPLA